MTPGVCHEHTASAMLVLILAESMIHRTRMFKSIMCLVAAMTGTSVLLGWIDPAPSPTIPVLSAAQIRGLAVKAVSDADFVRHDQWRSVEVLAVSAIPARSRRLAAATTRTDHHFRVDVNGRPSSTHAWIRQLASATPPTAVAIQVVRRGQNQPMTPPQWNCVRELIIELSDRLGSDNPQLPVRLHDDWADAYSVIPETALHLTPPSNPAK